MAKSPSAEYPNLTRRQLLITTAAAAPSDIWEEFPAVTAFRSIGRLQSEVGDIGGLLDHVVSLFRSCDLVCRNYPQINRDLLLTGAFLHDIGKIHELTYSRSFSYTTRGQLLGHMIIELEMLQAKIVQIPAFPDDLKTLLDLILTQSRRITQSDAGSLYLVEHSAEGTKRLRFRLAQTYSKPEAPFVEFTIPVDRTSLAGYCAVTGDPLVIDDAYFLPPDVEYTINRSFDERYGYRTKSMLVIPMKDHKEEVIGVLQLINRKRRFEAVLSTPAEVEQQVIPYSRRTVELVTALAGQAAVAIENSRLYEDIERLFEGFVLAAVTASTGAAMCPTGPYGSPASS